MSAPESVVNAIADVLHDRTPGCNHGTGGPSECYSRALDVAPAAFAASLEWAADELDAPILSDVLRRWARGMS